MSIRTSLAAVAAILSLQPALRSQDRGIVVEKPKIYDDFALRALLNAARANLGLLNPLDATGIATHIGAIQGADLRQSQFAIQAGTVPTVQNVTTTGSGTQGVVTTAGNNTSAPTTPLPTQTVTTVPGNTFQNVATQGGAAPTIPAVPGDSNVTLPSTFATSALDTLNEQMQLTYEIANLRLLLQGSLTDRFIEGRTELKRRTTIGFPISIDPPGDDDYENAVAEVEVTVTNGAPADVLDTAPSVTVLLPREKTYNVANIRDKSVSIGAGVVAGLLNVGGSFFWSHKTYYLVKDQDTIALQRRSRRVSNLAGAATASTVGDAGFTTRFYWVVAHFQAQTIPYGPIRAIHAPDTLSAANLVRIVFPAVSGADSYDVVTSSSSEFPGPCPACAVATNILPAANIVVDDIGGTRQLSSANAPLSTTFAWQFKPVLGQKKVAPGLRQTFVQLAFPQSTNFACLGSVQVVTKWLRYDPKTASTGELISS